MRSAPPAGPPRRARGRRGDVGPLGAHLRPHRAGRDGRHVLHPRQDVHVLRHRGDDRGRRGDARLAHGAPRDPLEARRPGREGPHPVPRPAPAAGRREPRSGRRSSTPALQASARLRCRVRRACSFALAVPVLHLHTAQSGLDSLPRNLPTVEYARPAAGVRSSARANPTLVAVQVEDRHPGVRFSAVAGTGGRRSSRRPPACTGPVDVDVNSQKTVGADRDPGRRATASTPCRPTPCSPAAQRRLPATIGLVTRKRRGP